MLELVIAGVPAFTVRVNDAEPVPAAFVALSVINDCPDAVGVPDITPVAALIDRPEGRPVAPKLVGLLEAVI